MKQTSLDKISQVYGLLVDGGLTFEAGLLKDVIRAESAETKQGKFDIYKFACKDTNLRPAMCGVFHDDGNKVASDAHVLVALKESYPEEYEHRVLYANGELLAPEIKYPNWRSVIPNIEQEDSGYVPIKVEAKKFYDWIAEKRADHKARCGKGIKFAPEWRCFVGEALLNAEFLDKYLTAMSVLGTDIIYVRDNRRCIVSKTDKGVVLLMPNLTGNNADDQFRLA